MWLLVSVHKVVNVMGKLSFDKHAEVLILCFELRFNWFSYFERHVLLTNYVVRVRIMVMVRVILINQTVVLSKWCSGCLFIHLHLVNAAAWTILL